VCVRERERERERESARESERERVCVCACEAEDDNVNTHLSSVFLVISRIRGEGIANDKQDMEDYAKAPVVGYLAIDLLH
jgi:hypothetical protein